MTVTQDTLGIGELARRTGVPVRTLRFYCDEGVLTPLRSTGGHRRFEATAVEHVRQLRRLRAVGLGLDTITEVLSGTRSLADALASARARAEADLAAAAWRQATLQAIAQAPPGAREARLDLLALAADGRATHAALVSFWHNNFLAPVAEDVLDMYLAAVAPPPPSVPTPAQVLAYAELLTLTATPGLAQALHRQTARNAAAIRDETEYLHRLGGSLLAVLPKIPTTPPAPGPDLDTYLAMQAELRGAANTPAFHRELLAAQAVDRTPPIRRYWRLAGELTGTEVTAGEAHLWLLDALAARLGQ